MDVSALKLSMRNVSMTFNVTPKVKSTIFFTHYEKIIKIIRLLKGNKS